MSIIENKALTRRLAEEFFNRKNLVVIEEVLAPDYVERDPLVGELRGREAVKRYWASFVEAFPDLHLFIEDEIAEGDLVAHRYRVTGTNTGPLPMADSTIPPTGRKVTWTGMHVIRIAGGRAVEGWGLDDILGMMQQLGLTPGQPNG